MPPMRPLLLNPLFATLTSLPGVGPKLERLYARLLEREAPRVIDLLLHLPSGVIDRRARPKLNEVQPGQVVTVAVTVEEHRAPPPHRARAPYRIIASDDTGTLTLTFFNARKEYLEKRLPVGETRYVSGTAEFYDGMLQMVHPDRVVDEQGFASLPLVEPVYPLTEGLAPGNVRRAMEGALARLPELPEWQDEAWIARERFPAFAAALRHLHRPAEPHDIAPESLAWTRLAYDELLAGQLALALVRAHMRRQAGRGSASEGRLRTRILKSLPYALTHSQQKAVDDIIADLARPQRMLRLLQGDVGSGKTVVALVAAAAVIEAGRQAPFMAPTEILARQHLNTIAPLAKAAGIRVAILTGRERGRERGEILDRLTLGDIDLLIGTHALFQEDVAFHDLALAVVDEQHRFGVHQRLALTQKGEAVDVLVLTATPIPRTLVLTYFGDMDISELREKPAGRQPIDTRTIPLSRIEEVEDAAGRVLDLLDARQRNRAGVDRLAAGRLLAQFGDVHVAEISQHQRARDRRGGEHQHVDRLALLRQRQPLMHAEAMLLVDNGERQIVERDILLEQRVGADQEIDVAERQPVENSLAFAAALAAGEDGDAQAGGLGQRRDGLEMLAGEDFGRRHERRLASGFDHRRCRD